MALRFWRSSWLGTRLVLKVKSDNVAALTLMATLKSSPTSNVVALEIALDIASVSFQLDIFSHSPGVSAIVVDKSRRYQPGVQFSIPQLLVDVPEGFPPARSLTYFLASNAPASHSAVGIKARVQILKKKVLIAKGLDLGDPARRQLFKCLFGPFLCLSRSIPMSPHTGSRVYRCSSGQWRSSASAMPSCAS